MYILLKEWCTGHSAGAAEHMLQPDHYMNRLGTQWRQIQAPKSALAWFQLVRLIYAVCLQPQFGSNWLRDSSTFLQQDSTYSGMGFNDGVEL
jgi:hypothetical protein